MKVEVCSKYSTVNTLQQQYLFIPAKFKDCYTSFILNEFAGNSIIVFTTTCNTCMKLSLLLRNLGFGAVPLHGKLSQPKRIGALNKFKTGERKILIATDVASRGLDIPSVDLVINYDIPATSKVFLCFFVLLPFLTFFLGLCAPCWKNGSCRSGRTIISNGNAI